MKFQYSKLILPISILLILIFTQFIGLISNNDFCYCVFSDGELPSEAYHVFGTHPRNWNFIYTAFTGSWIHGNWEHLSGNLVSLSGLFAIYLVFLRTSFFRFFILQWFISGLILFFVAAKGSIHLGASTWSYSFVGFLITMSILHPNRRSLSLFFIICLWYGSMIWGIFPIDPKVSIQGHISGLISGILIGLLGRDFWLDKMIIPNFKPELDSNEQYNQGVPENPYDQFD